MCLMGLLQRFDWLICFSCSFRTSFSQALPLSGFLQFSLFADLQEKPSAFVTEVHLMTHMESALSALVVSRVDLLNQLLRPRMCADKFC